MKKAVLVTLLAGTLGLGATALHAEGGDSEMKQGQGYSKHEDGKGKHYGKRHGKGHGKHGKRGGRKGGERMMKRLVEKLALTEEQQAQLKALQEEQKTTREAMREEMKSFREEMKALDTSSTDYNEKVAILADKKASMDRQKFIQRSEARQKFDAILTEEQRAKMQEMKEKRGGKKGGRKHRKDKDAE